MRSADVKVVARFRRRADARCHQGSNGRIEHPRRRQSRCVPKVQRRAHRRSHAAGPLSGQVLDRARHHPESEAGLRMETVCRSTTTSISTSTPSCRSCTSSPLRSTDDATFLRRVSLDLTGRAPDSGRRPRLPRRYNAVASEAREKNRQTDRAAPPYVTTGRSSGAICCSRAASSWERREPTNSASGFATP